MPTFLFIYTNPSDPSIYEANIYLFFRYTKAFEKIIFLSVYTNNYHQINISHLFSINIFVQIFHNLLELYKYETATKNKHKEDLFSTIYNKNIISQRSKGKKTSAFINIIFYSRLQVTNYQFLNYFISKHIKNQLIGIYVFIYNTKHTVFNISNIN